MSFRCQKCNADIKLDSSFQNILKSQARLLVSKVPKSLSQTHHLPNRYIPKRRLDKFRHVLETADGKAVISQDYTQLEAASPQDYGQSFVYLSDSEEPDVTTAKNHNHEGMGGQNRALEDQLPDFSKIRTLNQVFEILLDNQDVDHPMCSECADLLTDNYKLKFDQSQREKEYYISFLRKLKEREIDAAEREKSLHGNWKNAASEVKDLEASQRDKLAELEALEAKHLDLKKQLETLNEQFKDSRTTQLSKVYQMKNELTLNLQEKQHKLDQTKALYHRQLNHLDELRKFNVFTKLFTILFEGDYSVINGFRLGYKVPWPECNVALGQIVSMLEFLKNRLGLTLENYKLVPMGSKSYVVKQPSPQSEPGLRPQTSSVLHLYSSNEFTLGKLFNFNKLDVSMIALLDILAQFETQLLISDSDLSLPYKTAVRAGTLGGKSIRVTSNGQWTESCKYLLVNLNWILSYASAQQAN